MTGVPSVLSFESVYKTYGRNRVLAGLDLTVPAGCFLALTGANGAGKTTVLRLAAGLARADRGRITVAGTVLPDDDPRWRSSIGFLSHETALYADLTVRENLLFSARLFGIAEPAQRVRTVACWLDAERLLDRPVRILSRGMRQKAALMRVFLHNPNVILLDEPYTGLDEASASLLTQLLRRYHEAGHTIVAALHGLAPAAGMATRIVALRAGRVGMDRPAGIGEPVSDDGVVATR